MTDRHRQFTFLHDPEAPLKFDLAGSYATVRPEPAEGEPPLPTTWAESFQCYPRCAPQALAELAMARRVDVQGNPVWNSAAILAFIRRSLLTDDDRFRFAQLSNDPERALLVEDLGEVVVWLAEVYVDRPTTPPST